VTRKQMALLVGVNAVISTLITLLLVLVILPLIQGTDVGLPGPSGPVSTNVAAPGDQEDEATRLAAETGPEATATAVIHTVRAGDTISGLAEQYDVPQEDIIAANQLQNPNFLQVGTNLVIPVGGLQAATPTWTAVPTASDTPLPFEPPSADMTATAAVAAGATSTPAEVVEATLPATGELQIAITEVIAAGEADQERVVITNRGERLADMQAWTLSDGQGNTYTFPNFRLWPGGNVTIHTHIGQDGSPPNNFYWNKLVAMWSPGEVVTLKDAAGDVVSSYTAGP
jgi:LysM repeat protein